MQKGDVVKVMVTQVGADWVNVVCGEMIGALMLPELSWHATNPLLPLDKTLAVGDKLKVVVIAVAGQRFSMSLKRLEPNPWEAGPNIGEDYVGTVVRVAEYGYFVEITYFCHALLHVDDAFSEHTMGEKVRVRIVDVNRERCQARVVPSEST